MPIEPERRRHQRYDMTNLNCKLAWIRPGPNGMAQSCILLNCSYGGFAFRTNVAVREEEDCHFSIDWQQPCLGVATVRARIRWVQECAAGDYIAGAEFLESSKAWLGPEES
jgi:hypothetical protein